MPKVKCFAIPGLHCWFWSNDHDPPHFHVKKNGEWELTVKFLEGKDSMFEMKWGKAPKAKVLREIVANAIANRYALLLEWEDKGDE